MTAHQFLTSMKRILRIKRASIVVGILLAVYFFLYLLNSAAGGYDPHYTSDDRNRYGGGMLAHDCIMWQPRFGSYYNAYRHDFIGIAFYPLLQLDHLYIHKTHSIRDDDFPKWWESLLAADIHPKYRGDYERWKVIDLKYKPALEAAYARGDTAEAKQIRKAMREEENAGTNK